MDRKERKKQTEILEKNYQKVYKKLAKIKGFKGLEIGFKRKDGKMLTDKIVYRALVEEKVALDKLSPDEIIPKIIDGFDIDVVIVPKPIDILGITNLPDTGKYDTIHGGIQVGNGTGGLGTIGCVAVMTADNSKKVILSNKHVLYTGGVSDGQRVGNPDYDESSCCDCNYQGTNITSNDPFDCAIAELKEGVSITNTIEEIGTVNGSISTVVAGDVVRKRGRTTGLTEGTVESVNGTSFQVTVNVNAGNGRRIGYFDSSNNEVTLGFARDNGISNFTQRYDPAATEKFAYAGDSGSVMVLHEPGDPDHNKIVVLLNSIDGPTNTQGLGFRIDKVTDALNITIQSGATPPGINAVATTSLTYMVGTFEKALNETALGAKLVQLHYTHYSDVLEIIKTERKAKVLWNRNMGPRFVAALQRGIKNRGYVIPMEFDTGLPGLQNVHRSNFGFF